MTLPRTKRERLLGALRRKLEGYVPWDINPCPELLQRWKKHMQTDLHPYDFYDLDCRWMGAEPSKMKADWSAMNPDMPPGTEFDGYGIPHVPADSAEGHHFRHTMASALKNATSVEEVERYPWPDNGAEYRWTALPKKIRDTQAKGYAVVCGAGGYFEGMVWLRGMDLTLMELLTEEPIITAIVNKCAELTHANAIGVAKAGADIITFGDDIGMQRQMMIAPDLWRKWFKQPFAQAIRDIKAINPEALVFFHSDGNIEPVIPDLIEIGVDILNPVQPECMDPEKIKKQYGKHLSFWGTIGVQSTMPFGTPKEIRILVKQRIETVAKGGGLFLAPAHMLEPEVPLENVLAFIEAVQEYGGHRQSAVSQRTAGAAGARAGS